MGFGSAPLRTWELVGGKRETYMNLPFPPNKLSAGNKVTLSVKSATGTITAVGSITGKEV